MILGICLFISSLWAKTLIVELTNFKNADGVVRCALFQNQEGFPKDTEKAIKSSESLIQNKDKKAICQFEGLTLDECAVVSYHDEKQLERLETNWLGIPKNGIGISNNARGFMGPPTFERAKINIDHETKRISIQMQYL
jgi:uncharacterized protein (DUF2141 family)